MDSIITAPIMLKEYEGVELAAGHADGGAGGGGVFGVGYGH